MPEAQATSILRADFILYAAVHDNFVAYVEKHRAVSDETTREYLHHVFFPMAGRMEGAVFAEDRPQRDLQMFISIEHNNILLDFREEGRGNALFSRTVMPLNMLRALLYHARPNRAHSALSQMHYVPDYFRPRFFEDDAPAPHNPLQEGPWLKILGMLAEIFPPHLFPNGPPDQRPRPEKPPLFSERRAVMAPGVK